MLYDAVKIDASSYDYIMKVSRAVLGRVRQQTTYTVLICQKRYIVVCLGETKATLIFFPAPIITSTLSMLVQVVAANSSTPYFF